MIKNLYFLDFQSYEKNIEKKRHSSKKKKKKHAHPEIAKNINHSIKLRWRIEDMNGEKGKRNEEWWMNERRRHKLSQAWMETNTYYSSHCIKCSMFLHAADATILFFFFSFSKRDYTIIVILKIERSSKLVKQ